MDTRVVRDAYVVIRIKHKRCLTKDTCTCKGTDDEHYCKAAGCRTCDYATVICHKCGQQDKCSFMEPTGGRMKEHKLCFNCNFWIEIIEKYHSKGTSIIVKGSHYVDGGHVQNPRDRNGLGFAGHMWTIKKDGKTFFTNNLWHQGTIPEHFRDVLKDNAEFVR
jgi:hypothetical protein